ncbi:response regulator [Cucumibacter marinus]|uniref:response regulator n=1 Tax=Cucumibacter marinus TaxID=1121252 RepID=UPI00041A7ADE|nr:response regulator [Cucumibacter marinus]
MPANTAQPLRLLAVDDDAASAELIVRVAERCGFEAFATSDSRGVISLTKALQPDIIALDMCMPNIDAIELFGLLAECDFKGRILIVSGQDEAVLRDAKRTAESLGLSVPWLQQKPLDFGTLRSMLKAQAEDPEAALARRAS